MATALDDGGARLTSSLSDARNDTSRIAFCGPVVLSAITGCSVTKVEDEVRAFRDAHSGRPRSPTSATAWPSRRAT
jgi:hypothetical protein